MNKKIYIIKNNITKNKNILISENEEDGIRKFQKYNNMDPIYEPDNFELWEIGELDIEKMEVIEKEKTIITNGKFEKAIGKDLEKLISQKMNELIEKSTITKDIDERIKKIVNIEINERRDETYKEFEENYGRENYEEE